MGFASLINSFLRLTVLLNFAKIYTKYSQRFDLDACKILFLGFCRCQVLADYQIAEILYALLARMTLVQNGQYVSTQNFILYNCYVNK